MDHADQHREAIAKTVQVRNEVSCSVFDDKVRDCGTVTVGDGKIAITLDHLPSMVSADATRDFVVEAISLALKACFDARPSSFDKFS